MSHLNLPIQCSRQGEPSEGQHTQQTLRGAQIQFLAVGTFSVVVNSSKRNWWYARVGRQLGIVSLSLHHVYWGAEHYCILPVDSDKDPLIQGREKEKDRKEERRGKM